MARITTQKTSLRTSSIILVCLKNQKTGKVGIALTVDGEPMDDKTGHITIGFRV
jgi:hypothetical protein